MTSSRAVVLRASAVEKAWAQARIHLDLKDAGAALRPGLTAVRKAVLPPATRGGQVEVVGLEEVPVGWVLGVCTGGRYLAVLNAAVWDLDLWPMYEFCDAHVPPLSELDWPARWLAYDLESWQLHEDLNGAEGDVQI